VKAFTAYTSEDADENGIYANLDGNILRKFFWRTPKRGMFPQNSLTINSSTTCFGYLATGTLAIELPEQSEPHPILMLPSGFYFSIPGPATITSRGETTGLLVARPGYKSFLHIGLIEHEGRLRYIDGCTDSLLVPPIKRGDPCLNLLYFPPGIDQTMHTHPSERIGLILSGRGTCITPTERIALEPGMLFCIHPEGQHKFRTGLDSDMRVLAYHPDSDFGPTDSDHPMINRTMIDGISAAKLPAIHTPPPFTKRP